MELTMNNRNNNRLALLFIAIFCALVALACMYGCSSPKTTIKSVTRDSIVYVKQEVHDTVFIENTSEVESKSVVESMSEKTFEYTILAVNDSGKLEVKEKGGYHYTENTKKDSTDYYKNLYRNLLTHSYDNEQYFMRHINDSTYRHQDNTKEDNSNNKFGMLISIILLCAVLLALYLCNKAIKNR